MLFFVGIRLEFVRKNGIQDPPPKKKELFYSFSVKKKKKDPAKCRYINKDSMIISRQLTEKLIL